MKTNKYDTIIVGGGIAGLTATVYLARAGQKVLLIEKNREFGGLVNTFKRHGFQFEAGVRALESAGIILPMLEDIGIHLETVRSKVSVGVENDIVSIENLQSIKDYRNMLVKHYPSNEEEIDNFIKVMRKIMKYVDILYGIENPIFKDLKKDRKYIFTQLLPWLPKFIFTVGKINRLNKAVEPYLEEIISNASLRDIISQHFFKGTPTFFALSYFSLYLDYFYPKGGVGKIADALVEKILDFKGELKAKTIVKEVFAQDQYIVDEAGEKYFYNHLIWAADLKTLYKNTHIEGLDAIIKDKFLKMKDKLFQSRGGESIFSLYLEVDQPLSYFGNIANGHFFYTPSNKGLGKTHTEELEQLLTHWEKVSKTKLWNWLDRFIKLNTFEISIPGLKDPSLVPENKSGVIISFLMEHRLFEKVGESGWYDAFRQEIENKTLEVITQSVYPELKDTIIRQFSFTPMSIQERIRSSDGAIVGWTFEKSMPVLNNIQKADKAVITPIPNILQAGQWAYSPAGVPMSILTGKLAVDRILKNQKKV